MIKFLIIRFSSIGDIVLTTPILRCIKQSNCFGDDVEIHYLIKKQFADIINSNPYIDKVHIFDNKLSDVIKELKKENFDYIIDLHKNIRSWVVKSHLKLAAFSFKKLNFEKWLLVNFKINRLPSVHIVDRYFDTLKLFDVQNDNKGLDYFIPQKDEVDLLLLPDEFKNGYIAYVIGSRHFTKRLPTDKVISVCKKINFPLILLGGEEDEKQGNEIKKAVGSKAYNACGKYNINQSASFIRQSKLVITYDTGLMHIAAAFKKKIISIWGNTVPAFGMYPYLADKDSVIIQVEKLSCRPCTKLGFKRCPKKHFKCMNNINEEQIVQLAGKIFNS